MNEAEAKEILDASGPVDPVGHGGIMEAKGYLEASDKAKILTDTLKAVIENNDGEPYREFCRQAIAQYEGEI